VVAEVVELVADVAAAVVLPLVAAVEPVGFAVAFSVAFL